MACLGDSITAGVRYSDAKLNYPDQLQQILGDQYKVRNFGIGGATLIKTGRPNVWQNLDEVMKFQPHIVVVSLGTNDTVSGKRENWENINRFETDYTELVSKLKNMPTSPQIFIATPTAIVLETPGLSEDRLTNLTERKPRLQELCQRIRTIAREIKLIDVTLLELNHVLANHPELLTEKDGVHPNDKGYLAIAQTVAAQIQGSEATGTPPNIILIFVDDMGYGDLGCYGNELNKTPNIDQMAAAGQRWTSFYSSGATCVPSRKGLMTGRHPAVIRRENLIPHRDKLIASMLQERGYATAILGKWHLAGYPKDFTTSPMHPLECGFDYHFGTPGSNDVPSPPGTVQNRDLFDNCGPTTFQIPLIQGREVLELPVNQETLTQRYTAEAVKWINGQSDDRFFLYLAHNMPHTPIFASKEFQGQSANGRYGDVIEELDWSTGQIMNALEENNIADETLVVFTSDNGPWTMFGPHGGTPGPLRGEKGTTWEGGMRVPGIFYWPGTIEAAVIDGMAANLDLYATFATLAGGPPLSDAITRQTGFMSLDFSDTLLNESPPPRQQWHYGGGDAAFRSGNYKIHLKTKERLSNPNTRRGEPAQVHNSPLLFDLSNDIGESRNLGDDRPEIVEQLLAEMKDFLNRD